MKEAYFRATLRQIEERARRLLGDIPPQAEGMELLADACRRELENVIEEAEAVRTQAHYQGPAVQAERLQLVRNLFNQLDVLESSAVAAIQRRIGEDLRMTRLVRELANEINFPLPPPTVSCTSQEYFVIETGLKLIQMPLTDGRHLLHLPDLGHEMAHVLLTDLHNPRVKRFKEAVRDMQSYGFAHFHQRLLDLSLGPAPISLKQRIPYWQNSWKTSWPIEFFCDLFAVFAVGPAYGWAHHHLYVRMPTNAYYTPRQEISSHPADAARTQAIVAGLKTIGYEQEANDLAEGWQELMDLTHEIPDANFPVCYPTELMRKVTDLAFGAYQAAGCKVAAPQSAGECQRLMDAAWRKFRTDPEGYAAWEVAEMNGFYERFKL